MGDFMSPISVLLMKNIFIRVLLTFLSLACLSAQIEQKIVESMGSGTSLQNAINEALSEAIGRVNGKSLETISQLNSVSLTEETNDSSSSYNAEHMQSAVKSATKGVISSYDIVSKSENNGIWSVVLSAKIAKLKKSASSNRRRLAVSPLRSTQDNFNIDGRVIASSQFIRMLGQSLVSNLVQSRKFTVLDREFMQETLGEKARVLNGDMATEELVKLGQELFADYMLVGTLEDVNFTTEEKKMLTSDTKIKIRSGELIFGYRIIDVPTRQIKFADSAKIRISENDIRKVSGAFSQPDLSSSIISISSEKISKKILNAIYPMMIISARGNIVTLNQGGDLLKEGDVYDVFQFGEIIIDPYTNESLGRDEIFCATIEVTRVNPKSSYAKITSSEIEIGSVFKPKMFVCRPSKNQNTVANKQILKLKQKQEERKKERDDDW